jgi:hypothetical protein
MSMPLPSVDGGGGGGGGIHSPDASSDERYPYDNDRHHYHQPNMEIGTVPFSTHQSQLQNGGASLDMCCVVEQQNYR